VDSALTEADLVERLAHVCHQTWMKQKKRNDGIVADPNNQTPTPHDYERAEDIVLELKSLGIWNDPPQRL
jgi:hypothetical protein